MAKGAQNVQATAGTPGGEPVGTEAVLVSWENCGNEVQAVYRKIGTSFVDQRTSTTPGEPVHDVWEFIGNGTKNNGTSTFTDYAPLSGIFVQYYISTSGFENSDVATYILDDNNPNNPTQPTGLGVDETTLSSFTFSWDDNAITEDWYEVSVTVASTSATTIYRLDPNSESFTLGGLTQGESFFVRVGCTNLVGGFSGFSPLLGLTLPVDNPDPGDEQTQQILGFEATVISTSVDLFWFTVNHNPNQLARIERSDNGVEWVEVGAVPALDGTFRQTGLGTERTYFYRAWCDDNPTSANAEILYTLAQEVTTADEGPDGSNAITGKGPRSTRQHSRVVRPDEGYIDQILLDPHPRAIVRNVEVSFGAQSTPNVAVIRLRIGAGGVIYNAVNIPNRPLTHRFGPFMVEPEDALSVDITNLSSSTASCGYTLTLEFL